MGSGDSAQRLLQRRAEALAQPALPSNWPRAALGFAAALALLIGATIAVHLSRNANPAPTSAPAPELEPRAARARRVCEATRARVMRGGTVTPADAEGWWVEISLLRPPAQDALPDVLPALITRGPEGTLRLRADPERDAPSWRIVELDEQPGARAWRSTLTLDDGAVRRYFDASDRAALLRAARNLALAVQASHAAVYARCQHSRSHQVGGWFWGRDPASALAALIGFTLAYADSPLLHPSLSQGEAGEPRPLLELLETIESRAGRLTRRQLSLWLADERAALVSAPPYSARAAPSPSELAALQIVFPFSDSNRAARAGLRLARQLSLAPR